MNTEGGGNYDLSILHAHEETESMSLKHELVMMTVREHGVRVCRVYRVYAGFMWGS